MPPLLLLLSVVLVLFAAADASPSACRNATCGGQTVAYPFWLLNASAFDCGYPGLGLLCVDSTTLILPFRTHQYRVLDIEYGKHTISLTDADMEHSDTNSSCPHLHANLTIDDNSWLQLASSDSNITFLYKCKSNSSLLSSTSAVKLTRCGAGPEHIGTSYVFLDGWITGEAYDYECEMVVVAPVIDAHKKAMVDAHGGLPPADRSFGDVLSAGFELTYSAQSEKCGQCERTGGLCGYRHTGTSTTMDFTCFCDGSAITDDHCGDSSLERRKKLYIIAGTSSVLLLCLLYFACLFSLKKYRHRRISKGTPRIESFLQRNGTLHPKRYTYTEVKRMTKSFAEKLGHGGFGAVYKGNLSDGRQVAVKMLKDSKGDGEEFINEVASISRTSHVNVVSLLGFCLHRSKRALIYEYMPNGSLERYAFRKNSKGELSLTWEKLFDVAVGIARGLEYLHRGCSTRIVHFDIKPHNILLDQEFCPKISDFGMAKLCANKESIVSIAGARGTIGYIAPEVYSKQFGAITSKSDVYSYGMMILEMVGARERNIDANSESSSHYFPQWIYEHLDEYCISSSEIDGETTELVRKMVVVALWCIQVVPTNRPTMTRVVEMLEGSTGGLELPPKVLLSW
ncbi:LEAF RUST 10 DISEASE-RESISTANCE LOCUS RECEPTOR-LIKE PROTEIN KINASE-like 2.1 isoform X2 [Oryza glaberrima]|uniref:LEAF RUST 10 DISEASE-RESISTANCE LOCUS RECEPTOR-LIKE PROTEIN KINASE-like 2.1 isoform X2 n=1 Tax=Oryza glaberrima TaxID=4538 RepID=UPI00224C1DFA|nr:LEAF RUST 10 DISEASE-RESISTANCE LOCUS RECEPTOR-LIKE PROTEIN KINASE-like 2.1 isoform X2 [Oryza glaberrima]